MSSGLMPFRCITCAEPGVVKLRQTNAMKYKRTEIEDDGALNNFMGLGSVIINLRIPGRIILVKCR